MWYVMGVGVGRGEANLGIWWRNLREKDNLEVRNPDGRIILEWILKKSFGKAWIELIWFRIEIRE